MFVLPEYFKNKKSENAIKMSRIFGFVIFCVVVVVYYTSAIEMYVSVKIFLSYTFYHLIAIYTIYKSLNMATNVMRV